MKTLIKCIAWIKKEFQGKHPNKSEYIKPLDNEESTEPMELEPF
jgi:hypothetical protein